ncbi:MAG: GNAT family N-acetyltransferase [Bacillota bacterium]|nr:GNAT family N-acetyltransferase [Bacillota bacterium]
MDGRTETWSIREFGPGDLGYIAHRHGVIYSREYDLGVPFEGYVIASMAEFLDNKDPVLDHVWIAEVDGRFAGCIALIGRGRGQAQLRWFLVEPEFRGKGIGKTLMAILLDHCRRARVKNIYLWTLSVLDAARAVYERAGFRLTEQKTHEMWGKNLTEQRWDLDMGGRENLGGREAHR